MYPTPHPNAHPAHTEIHSFFCQKLHRALAQLTRQLQAQYEQAFPGHGETIQKTIREAQIAAWDLSPFPHLLFPDLVEARIGELALQPVYTQPAAAFAYAA